MIIRELQVGRKAVDGDRGDLAELVSDDDRLDAGHRQGGGLVDGDDARVGVGAADEGDVQAIAVGQVVDVAAEPLDKLALADARPGSADLAHGDGRWAAQGRAASKAAAARRTAPSAKRRPTI